MGDLTLREKFDAIRRRTAAMREKAKEGTALVTETILGAVVAGGLGALDQSKGTVPTTSVSKIAYYSLGPVPVSLLVGAVGKLAALGTMGNQFESRSAAALGQAGIDVAAYLGGREAWARHAANAAAAPAAASTG